MKASNPGNTKNNMEYIFDLPVTLNDPLMNPYDLKIENLKTMTLS